MATAQTTQQPNDRVIRALQSPLVVSFAQEYKVEPGMLFGTLLRTVFPKDDHGKPQGTIEQFLAFLSVAQQYKLNPFLREIYAFPTKGGGICPVVPIDGWIKIIQSQQKLDGIKYFDNVDSNGNLVSITCAIRRKDMSEPVEVTEYMEECARSTEPWKKWPRRMLRHKATIQCARIAFGLAGIYDPDEGERIIEAEAGNGHSHAEIVMPQRTNGGAVRKEAQTMDHDAAEVVSQMTDHPAEEEQPEKQPAPAQESAHTEPQHEEPTVAAEAAEELQQEATAAPSGARPEPKQVLKVPEDQWITTGQKKKLFAVMNSAKVHNEAQLREHIWAEYGIEHITEIPKPVFNDLLAWAGGEALKIK